MSLKTTQAPVIRAGSRAGSMEWLLLFGRSERNSPNMQKLLITTLMLSLGIMVNATARADDMTQSSQKAGQAGMSYQKGENAKKIMSSLKDKCGADINKYCSGIKPGEGRIAACLQGRQDQLSSQCKDTWTSAKADISKRIDSADVAFRKQCGSDVQKFCSNVPSGKGRLLSCLGDHQSELSASCKNFHAKLEQRLDEFVS